MSRELEFNKPLSIDYLRHFLKDLDAAGVVYDEVVVGTEDGGDFLLGVERGLWHFKQYKLTAPDTKNNSTRYDRGY